MIIDFETIAQEHVEGFKGGKGPMETRKYVDEKCRIMYSTLHPGSSSGEHLHEENCEVIMVLSGELTFHYDDQVETCRQGQVHYCPKGHSHWVENCTDHDALYFAIVAEHR